MRFFKCSLAQCEVLNPPEATNSKCSFSRLALIAKHKPTARVQKLPYSLVCALHAAQIRLLQNHTRECAAGWHRLHRHPEHSRNFATHGSRHDSESAL